MPNLANAKKALRQSLKRAERRQPLLDEIHSERRAFRKLIEGGKLEEAKTIIPKLYKMLDKAVTKNLFKKNKSARIKARIALKANKATQK